MEVGKIESDKACFLNLNFTIDILTGEIEIDLDYDKRIVKNKKRLTEVSNNFLAEIEEIISEDLNQKAKESEDKQC